MKTIKFSESLALRISNLTSFSRGQEYFKDGAVKKIWQEENEFKAVVEGNRRYTVTIKLDEKTDDGISCSCSCPYNFDGACKHIVATIFAFSQNPKFNQEIKIVNNSEKEKIEKLFEKITLSELKDFVTKIIIEYPQIKRDFQIFLQGQKQTPVTKSQYKTKFRQELDELDIDELSEAWLRNRDDYYDSDYSNEYGDDLPNLDDIVDNFMGEAEKYKENKNFGEALKIYQAIFEVLKEKNEVAKVQNADASEWFDENIEKVEEEIVKFSEKIGDETLRKILIEFFCENRRYKAIEKITNTKNEAELALQLLEKLSKKTNLEIQESKILAFLNFKAERSDEFEQISQENLEKNPSLSMNLLEYYKNNNQIEKLISTSQKVLENLEHQKKKESILDYQDDFENKKIEIEIRKFVRPFFATLSREIMIINLEKTFFLTEKLCDYQELSKNFIDFREKTEFLKRMKVRFEKEHGNERILFEIYAFENRFEEILDLIRKYTDASCFPDMILSIKTKFSKECFEEYKKKICKMLEVANVSVYPEAVFHLQKMKQIDLQNEFSQFMIDLKLKFHKRSRFLEELKSGKL